MNKGIKITYPQLQDTVKTLLRKTFIAISAYMKKLEKHQVNQPIIHLQGLEKQEQNNPEINRKKINMKEEITQT